MNAVTQSVLWLQNKPNLHLFISVESCYEVFSVWFSPNVFLMARDFHIGPVCPKNVVLDVLWFVQM